LTRNLTVNSGAVIRDITVSIKQVLKSRPLNSPYRDPSYPLAFTPFYIYGSSQEMNIDHMLLRSPNCQFSADDVALEFDSSTLTDADLSTGAILCLNKIFEEPMQPFPENTELQASSSFWFRPGHSLAFQVYKDIHSAEAPGPGLVSHIGNKEHLLATGTMTLGKGVFVDSEAMNTDPLKRKEKVVKWREEFDKIGQSMVL
jgi:hypothetical protein